MIEEYLNRVKEQFNNFFYLKEKLFIEVKPEYIYVGLMQFAQAISKITNMRLYKREVIHSMFFEMLEEYVMDKLQKYNPLKRFYPIPGHEEYEVDYCFNHRRRPIYLFGVNGSSNSRLATISCQKFISEKLNFSSLVVLENLDVLGKRDQARLMSA